MSEAAHSHAPLTTVSTGRTRLILAGLLLPFILLAGWGAGAYWPGAEQQRTSPFGQPASVVQGNVTQVITGQCQADTPAAGTCLTADVRLTSGPDANQTTSITLPLGPGQVTLQAGDAITLGRSSDVGPATYYFTDFQRKNGLLFVGLAFALLVVGVARWRGIGALIGLGLTFLVVTQFLIPALLGGAPPVPVTLVSAAVIMLLVLYVAHGPNARTTTAILGTLVTLVFVGIASEIAVSLSRITGLSSEEVAYVQAFAQGINIDGLLLGGIILGALGVLNDMSVSQASAVWELHAARPDQSRRALYRGAMRIGRDHIASTVYTLVLAYTGASLPLLLLFTLSDQSLGTILTTDLVGEELVRAAVGGIGIVLSVPITTALAAAVVKGQRERDTPVSDAVEEPAEPVDSTVATDAAPSVQENASEAAHEDAESAVAVARLQAGVEHLPTTSVPSRRRWWQRRRDTSFTNRPMSRRERKFWEE